MSKQVSKFNPKQVKHMEAVYTALIAAKADDDTRRAAIQKMANEFGLSSRSIIGKLSTMANIQYQPYEGKKPTAPRITNQILVNEIAAAIGASVDDLASLVRGSKKALQAVHDAILGDDDESEAAKES